MEVGALDHTQGLAMTEEDQVRRLAELDRAIAMQVDLGQQARRMFLASQSDYEILERALKAIDERAA